MYIGINGCSLKTSENLEVVKRIPLDRLLLETGECVSRSKRRRTDEDVDAPWCTPTSSHVSSAYLPSPDSPMVLRKVAKPEKWAEGMGVKGRMEPAEVSGIMTE